MLICFNDSLNILSMQIDNWESDEINITFHYFSTLNNIVTRMTRLYLRYNNKINYFFIKLNIIFQFCNE